MYLAAWIYNQIHFNYGLRHRLSNKFILKASFLKACSFRVKGKNNTLITGSKSRIKNCTFTFIGNNCQIVINGGSTIISNVSFWCQDDNSKIIIGSDFTMEGGHIASTEGKCITIGNDCMFSESIEIRNGDSHSIIDTITQKRINESKSVIIGNHVWLAAHSKVLKGAIIPNNSIVGNSSIVSSQFHCENAIYVGNPAKLLKENTNKRKDIK